MTDPTLYESFELTRRDVREITQPVRWIINAWLKSGARARPFPAMSAQRYYSDHRELLLRLLGKHGATIAHVPGEPDLYIGFVCGGLEPAPLHYVYVKQSAWRRLGVGTALLRERGPDRTHRSDKPWTEEWLDRLGFDWSPYKLTEPS